MPGGPSVPSEPPMIELVAVVLLVAVATACISIARRSMSERRRTYAVLAAPSDAAIPEGTSAPLVFLRRPRSARAAPIPPRPPLLVGALGMVRASPSPNRSPRRLRQPLARCACDTIRDPA